MCMYKWMVVSIPYTTVSGSWLLCRHFPELCYWQTVTSFWNKGIEKFWKGNILKILEFVSLPTRMNPFISIEFPVSTFISYFNFKKIKVFSVNRLWTYNETHNVTYIKSGHHMSKLLCHALPIKALCCSITKWDQRSWVLLWISDRFVYLHSLFFWQICFTLLQTQEVLLFSAK